jgi:hypothetical protein
LIEALYLAGKFFKNTFFSFDPSLCLGNDHLVQLLDETFFLSNIRQQLDAEYRFPTALARQLTIPTSIDDEKLLNMKNEPMVTRISIPELNGDDAIKFDEEVHMGFEVQLLTDDVLQKYPQLDPMTRTIKVINYFIL